MSERILKAILVAFGTAVKTKRRELGISQEELAYRSGLHRTYVTDVERGVRNMTLESASRLAMALDVHLVDLLSKPEKISLEGFVGTTKIIENRGSRSKPVNILLVEDNPKHVEITLHALERNGVTNSVVVAHTGEEALDYLLGHRKVPRRESGATPEVVLLDLTLPTMGGLEVLRRIRADGRTKSIPVVVLTASRSEEDYMESMKLGVSGYITKPVDFIEFSTVMPKAGFQWVLLKQE